MSPRLRGASMLAALLLTTASLEAHSLAGTIVSAALDRPGIITVTIEAEADPLIVKLEALGGVTADAPMTNADRRARLQSLFPVLRTHIDGRLSGRPLEFNLRDVAVDDTAQVAVHLTASVPHPSTSLRAGGRLMFTWRSTFIFGAYQLVTRGRAGKAGDGAGEAVEWLQGPQTSTPIALEPLRADALVSATGLTPFRIGYSLAMGALVVYVLTRRRLAQTRP